MLNAELILGRYSMLVRVDLKNQHRDPTQLCGTVVMMLEGTGDWEIDLGLIHCVDCRARFAHFNERTAKRELNRKGAESCDPSNRDAA